MTFTEASQLTKEQIARAFGVPAHILVDPDRPAAPRTWALCMTSENFGEVGPVGSAFQHRSEKHERVLVVEVPAASGEPVDQVNLQLVGARGCKPVAEFKGYIDGQPAVTWLDRDNMPRVGTKLFAGATPPVDTAAPAVGSASRRAAVDHALKKAQAWASEEYVCARSLGQGGPGTHAACDAKQAACIAAIEALAVPVAAQAGQVAVPGWISVDDRMPEFRHECTSSGCEVSDSLMVYGQNEFGTTGCGFGHARDDGTWATYEAEYDQLTVVKVTHWMPLPPSPARESK